MSFRKGRQRWSLPARGTDVAGRNGCDLRGGIHAFECVDPIANVSRIELSMVNLSYKLALTHPHVNPLLPSGSCIVTRTAETSSRL